MGYFALVKYSSHLPLQIKVVACSDRQPLFVIHIADLSLTPSCVEILVLQSLFIRICHANWPSLRYGKVTCNLLSYLPGKTSGNAPAYQRGRVIKTGSLTSALDCKTVGFFLKISKEIGKAGRKSLTRARASHALRACEAREKKRIFSVSPQSRSLFWESFQTFCLTARAYLNTQLRLARTWIRKNSDCFAV